MSETEKPAMTVHEASRILLIESKGKPTAAIVALWLAALEAERDGATFRLTSEPVDP